MNCDCKMTEKGIIYCPLHEAAPKMYEALLAIINSETIKNRDNFNNGLEALAEAKGKV